MKFNRYCQRRDSQMLFESAGCNKNDVVSVAQAMDTWVNATHQLLETMNRVPETKGTLGSPFNDSEEQGGIDHSLTLEVQKARNMMEEYSLEILVSQINQYAARISAACDRL